MPTTSPPTSLNTERHWATVLRDCLLNPKLTEEDVSGWIGTRAHQIHRLYEQCRRALSDSESGSQRATPGVGANEFPFLAHIYPDSVALFAYDRCLDAGMSVLMARRIAYLVRGKARGPEYEWVDKTAFGDIQGGIWKRLQHYGVEERKGKHRISTGWEELVQPEEHGYAYLHEPHWDDRVYWLLEDGQIHGVTSVCKGKCLGRKVGKARRYVHRPSPTPPVF